MPALRRRGLFRCFVRACSTHDHARGEVAVEKVRIRFSKRRHQGRLFVTIGTRFLISGAMTRSTLANLELAGSEVLAGAPACFPITRVTPSARIERQLLANDALVFVVCADSETV